MKFDFTRYDYETMTLKVGVDPGHFERAVVSVLVNDRVVALPKNAKLCLPHGSGEDPFLQFDNGRKVYLDHWLLQQGLRGERADMIFVDECAKLDTTKLGRFARAALKGIAAHETSKSEGQIAHEKFHETMAELGANAYKKGWDALTDDRKTAWQAAAEAVVDMKHTPTGRIVADPPYMRVPVRSAMSSFAPLAMWSAQMDSRFKDLKKKNDNSMQEKVTALNNEIQRLRGQVEQTQRELSNARIARDEAQAELTHERNAHDETKAESKKVLEVLDSVVAERTHGAKPVFDVQRRVMYDRAEIQASRLFVLPRFTPIDFQMVTR